MKNWQETQALLEQLRTRLGRGETVAWATVVAIKGSTYRRPGAKLLIASDGELAGNVSGGCLEQDIRERALQVLQTGCAACVHYDTSDVEDALWGLGLGCNGAVDLFIQPITPENAGWVESLWQALDGETPLTLRTTLEGAAVGQTQWADAQAGEVTGRAEGCFQERLEPPPTVWVCGAGDDALPLVALLDAVGFRVTVLDHRSAFLTAARFPAARRLEAVRPDEWEGPPPTDNAPLVVVKTHTLQYDMEWVTQWVKVGARYIGLLGPRARREEIVAKIEPSAAVCIFGPAGLDLGGEGPEQVALSIVAEVLAVYHQRTGGHLRDRSGAIH